MTKSNNNSTNISWSNSIISSDEYGGIGLDSQEDKSKNFLIRV